MTPAPLFEDVADAPAGGAAYWLQTSDGLRIRVARWNGGDKGTVLLFPGRTEYIEKYGRTAAEFQKRGFSTIVIDWRGQGLADRMLDDPTIGHVNKFRDYQKDVKAVLDALPGLDVPSPLFLLGHSMGGCIGLRALYEKLPVNAAIFSAPMWGILMSPALRPFAWALSTAARPLGLSGKLSPGTKSGNYAEIEPFEDNLLTTNPDMFTYMKDQSVAHPELGVGGPSLRWLNEALRETLYLSRRRAPKMPCVTYLGKNERIVDVDRIKDRMKNWANGQLELVDGSEHELMMETPEIQKQFFDGTVKHFSSYL